MKNLVKTGVKRRREIDKLVEKGFSLREIGERVGLSHEGVRQYIMATKQDEHYRKRRGKVGRGVKRGEDLAKKNLIEIYGLLIRRMWQLAREEGWASEKALKYHFSRRGGIRNIPLEKLINFLKTYEEAKKSGNKLTLEKLAEISGINVNSASRILRSVGEKPFYGNRGRGRKKISEEERMAIIRGYGLDMAVSDIAYFLEISRIIVQRNFNEIGGKREVSRKLYRNELTYRIISQIYEAQDLGFSNEEISFLLDLESRIVDYAVENREEMSKRIIRALTILYDRKFDKPYL